jgi:hypothetical protein
MVDRAPADIVTEVNSGAFSVAIVPQELISCTSARDLHFDCFALQKLNLNSVGS